MAQKFAHYQQAVDVVPAPGRNANPIKHARRRAKDFIRRIAKRSLVGGFPGIFRVEPVSLH